MKKWQHEETGYIVERDTQPSPRFYEVPSCEQRGEAVPAVICKDCALYEPDDVNPAGGLGDCPVNRANPRQVAILHKDVKHKYQLHYHGKLIYPNITGCSQWQGKPEGKQE